MTLKVYSHILSLTLILYAVVSEQLTTSVQIYYSKSCLASLDLNRLNQQLHVHVLTFKNRPKSELFEF